MNIPIKFLKLSVTMLDALNELQVITQHYLDSGETETLNAIINAFKNKSSSKINRFFYSVGDFYFETPFLYHALELIHLRTMCLLKLYKILKTDNMVIPMITQLVIETIMEMLDNNKMDLEKISREHLNEFFEKFNEVFIELFIKRLQTLLENIDTKWIKTRPLQQKAPINTSPVVTSNANVNKTVYNSHNTINKQLFNSNLMSPRVSTVPPIISTTNQTEKVYTRFTTSTPNVNKSVYNSHNAINKQLFKGNSNDSDSDVEDIDIPIKNSTITSPRIATTLPVFSPPGNNPIKTPTLFIDVTNINKAAEKQNLKNVFVSKENEDPIFMRNVDSPTNTPNYFKNPQIKAISGHDAKVSAFDKK